MTYKVEAHNEQCNVEDSLLSLNDAAVNLSNWLYERDNKHPLLDPIHIVIDAIDGVDFESPYAAAQFDAGDDWWDEVDE